MARPLRQAPHGFGQRCFDAILPHAPQFALSLAVLTQVPAQFASPDKQAQFGSATPRRSRRACVRRRHHVRERLL
ncbi:MAG TPA: hypothetical protein VGM03_16340 [Phycisphaerae bacterium]